MGAWVKITIVSRHHLQEGVEGWTGGSSSHGRWLPGDSHPLNYLHVLDADLDPGGQALRHMFTGVTPIHLIYSHLQWDLHEELRHVTRFDVSWELV